MNELTIERLESEIVRQRKRNRRLVWLIVAFFVFGAWNTEWVKKAWASVAANVGDPLRIGVENIATQHLTSLIGNTTNETTLTVANDSGGEAFLAKVIGNNPAIQGINSGTGNGVAVYGDSSNGNGVEGQSDSRVGVRGVSSSLYGGEFDGGPGRGQIHFVVDSAFNRAASCADGELRAEKSLLKGSPTILLFCSLGAWKMVQTN